MLYAVTFYNVGTKRTHIESVDATTEEHARAAASQKARLTAGQWVIIHVIES